MNKFLDLSRGKTRGKFKVMKNICLLNTFGMRSSNLHRKLINSEIIDGQCLSILELSTGNAFGDLDILVITNNANDINHSPKMRMKMFATVRSTVVFRIASSAIWQLHLHLHPNVRVLERRCGLIIYINNVRLGKMYRFFIIY